MRSDTRRIGRFTARKRRSAGNKLIGANWRTERADAVFQRFMAEKKKFQAIKGTRDLLPPETELWNRVEQTAREVFGTFGFGEIRLPIMEETELFGRAIGAETDIISKEMFSWQEGGTLIESELPKVWMLKHHDEFSAASPEFVFENQQRADLVVSKGDQTLVVEFKRRTVNQ